MTALVFAGVVALLMLAFAVGISFAHNRAFEQGQTVRQLRRTVVTVRRVDGEWSVLTYGGEYRSAEGIVWYDHPSGYRVDDVDFESWLENRLKEHKRRISLGVG